MLAAWQTEEWKQRLQVHISASASPATKGTVSSLWKVYFKLVFRTFEHCSHVRFQRGAGQTSTLYHWLPLKCYSLIRLPPAICLSKGSMVTDNFYSYSRNCEMRNVVTGGTATCMKHDTGIGRCELQFEEGQQIMNTHTHTLRKQGAQSPQLFLGPQTIKKETLGRLLKGKRQPLWLWGLSWRKSLWAPAIRPKVCQHHIRLWWAKQQDYFKRKCN